MEEIDRLHDAYDKTDRVARQRDAAARAQAELQAETEAAIAEGRPTPAQLEKQRQIDHEAALSGKPKKKAKPVTALEPSEPLEGGVNGIGFQEALEAAAQEAVDEEYEEAGWYRGGVIVLSWGISKADEHDGAQIGFQIQLPGEEEPGVLVVDLDEKRLKGWESGLQNADGPRRFAYGLVSKLFEIASQNVSAALHGAITEVQEGLHLNGPQEPAQSATEDAAESDALLSDQPEADEEPHVLTAAEKAYFASAGQPPIEVVSYGMRPEEKKAAGEAAKAFLEKNSGK